MSAHKEISAVELMIRMELTADRYKNCTSFITDIDILKVKRKRDGTRTKSKVTGHLKVSKCDKVVIHYYKSSFLNMDLKLGAIKVPISSSYIIDGSEIISSIEMDIKKMDEENYKIKMDGKSFCALLYCINEEMDFLPSNQDSIIYKLYVIMNTFKNEYNVKLYHGNKEYIFTDFCYCNHYLGNV